MTRPSCPARVALAAAGATLATLALGACTPSLLGSAAVVEGQRIPISEVEGAIIEVRDLQVRYGGPDELGPRAAHDEVHRRVIEVVFARAARELGVTVTDGEVAEREAQERTKAGSEDAYIQGLALQNGVSVDQIPNLLRRAILTEKMLAKVIADAGGNIGQAEAGQKLTELLVDTAKKMQIRVNPRYGTFDAERGQIVPAQPDYFRPPSEAVPAPPPPADEAPAADPRAEQTGAPTEESS